MKQSTAIAVGASFLSAIAKRSFAAEAFGSSAPPRELYTAVNWGMIETDGGVTEKFQLCKDLGYTGMELVSPLDGFTIADVNAGMVEVLRLK